MCNEGAHLVRLLDVDEYRFCIIGAMKVTLDIRHELLARSQKLAARRGTSLTKILEEALALQLRRSPAPRGTLVPLPVSTRSGGLVGRVDGTRNRSLLDAADE